MKAALFLIALALVSCHIKTRPAEKNFDPVEILRCVVNSPEVYQYLIQIIDLVQQGKYDEINKIVIEALPTIVKKAVECAFPSKNFDPVEIIKCVVNSPEVLKYVTKIIALVKEGKLDEIQAVIIEALPAVVYKAFECAFPENSPRPNFHREHKLHRPHFPHFPRKPRPFTRIGNPCGEGFHACGCNSAKMNEDKRAHNRVAKYCCCEDTE